MRCKRRRDISNWDRVYFTIITLLATAAVGFSIWNVVTDYDNYNKAFRKPSNTTQTELTITKALPISGAYLGELRCLLEVRYPILGNMTQVSATTTDTWNCDAFPVGSTRVGYYMVNSPEVVSIGMYDMEVKTTAILQIVAFVCILLIGIHSIFAITERMCCGCYRIDRFDYITQF